MEPEKEVVFDVSAVVAALEAVLPELAQKSKEAGLELSRVILSFGQVSLSINVNRKP